MSSDLIVTKRRGLFWYLGWSITGLIGLALVYWLGRISSANEREFLREERDVLLQQVEESEIRIADLEQQTIALQSSAQVDATASEQIMDTITSLQQNIDSLETELSFYRGIMAPERDVKGLQVADLKLNRLAAPRTYGFHLVLTQVKTHKNFIKGEVSISIEGLSGKRPQVYPIDELSDPASHDLRFTFRYFQNIKGEFRLPDDFLPQRISITAVSSGVDAQTAEKTFDWTLGH